MSVYITGETRAATLILARGRAYADVFQAVGSNRLDGKFTWGEVTLEYVEDYGILSDRDAPMTVTGVIQPYSYRGRDLP